MPGETQCTERLHAGLTPGAPTALAANEAQNTGLKTGHYMFLGGSRDGLARWTQRVFSFRRGWKFKLETRNWKLEIGKAKRRGRKAGRTEVRRLHNVFT